MKSHIVPILFFLSVFVFSLVRSQGLPFAEAPEKWGSPVKITEVSGPYDVLRSASLTGDEKTMYLSVGSRIAVSYRQENGWTTPAFLGPPINIPQVLTESPSITPDGKTLIFSRYGPGYWVLFQSNWNDSLKNWGEVTDLGDSISYGGGNFGMIPDSARRHLVFFRGLPLISHWNDTTQSWGLPQWVDYWKTLGVTDGLWMSPDLHKLYYNAFLDGIDIYVHYYDTVSSSWSDPMRLNLHAMLDTSANPNYHYQGYPWLSLDGHRMYFTSTHEGDLGVYTSNLVVDEHGDTVVSSIGADRTGPSQAELLQNYPNPFNPSTTIRYGLPHKSAVQLTVFNALGQQVAILVQGEKEAGYHEVRFDGSGLSSGVYFYRLQAGDFAQTKRLMLLK